ncbi:MAG: lytic transglycosylase domain-containing protein [Alphaproteobacteria bacterium]|nr:lytic transglycosylase domain-containing protein [Alphaproteobacteria bacterium]
MGVNVSLCVPLRKKALCGFLIFVFFTVLIDSASAVQARETVDHADGVEAVNLIEANKWDKATEHVNQSKDPLVSKLYYWMMFTNVNAKDVDPALFMQLVGFIRNNPDWPRMKKITSVAETIMPKDLPPKEAEAWFKEFPPQTSDGMGRYMDALIALKKDDIARKVLADWWASTLVSRDQQRQIFSRYGQYLTLEAHKKRLDALLYAGHNENALAIASVLGQGYLALAKARIALAGGRKNGLKDLIDNVPSYLQEDPGLLYERLRWRSKNNLNDGALEILEKEIEVERVPNAKNWWNQRHIIVRELIADKKYAQAYNVITKHMQKEGFAYAQAEWLAGWLSLRFLNQPDQAYKHFTTMYEKVSTPISKGRAAYWAGRAALAQKQDEMAKVWMKRASEFSTSFYGQMAIGYLSLKNELPTGKAYKLSNSDRKNFQNHELVQVASILRQAGLKDISLEFYKAFIRQKSSPKAYRYVVETLIKVEDVPNAVLIAKKASHAGFLMTHQAYPLITDWVKEDNNIELAFIHAIIRQESVFDTKAVSNAGARGLMQLMPVTAKQIAKKEGVKYNKSWLGSRPEYNIRLGTSYLEDLLNRYDGNYALAIAAYNAGPSRVSEWLRVYGDPRKGEIDFIDWIELIPIYETRNYVQRVMENIYVYRLRLKGIQSHPTSRLHVAFHNEK